MVVRVCEKASRESKKRKREKRRRRLPLEKTKKTKTKTKKKTKKFWTDFHHKPEAPQTTHLVFSIHAFGG